MYLTRNLPHSSQQHSCSLCATSSALQDGVKAHTLQERKNKEIHIYAKERCHPLERRGKVGLGCEDSVGKKVSLQLRRGLASKAIREAQQTDGIGTHIFLCVSTLH